MTRCIIIQSYLLYMFAPCLKNEIKLSMFAPKTTFCMFRYFQGYLLEETKNEEATEYHARTSGSSTNPAASGAGVENAGSTEGVILVGEAKSDNSGSESTIEFNWVDEGIELPTIINPMRSARNIDNSGEAHESTSSLSSDSRPRRGRASLPRF